MLHLALTASVVVSLISLIGILFLILKKDLLQKILLYLVALSAGTLIGGAFIHLIPEAVEEIEPEIVGLWVIAGISVFFIVERFLHWHHCHKNAGKCNVHTLSYMNLLGDGVHNFIDGVIISAGFLASTSLGIATTFAVISHEVPQEISDFGVLVYGGFTKTKALLYNFLSASLAILGVVTGYILASYIENFIGLALAFAAGGFIYIAASDLIPELHREEKLKQSIVSFAFFGVGIILMLFIKEFFGHHH
jgi:zinc and cadmium transporter